MFKPTTLLFALTLLASAGAATAWDPTTVPPGREFEFEVRELFFKGLRGDREAFEESMRLCDEALAADPQNPEAIVWKGSGEVFRAGIAYEGGDWMTGNETLERGLQMMNRAVELAPEHLGVRIPRAATLLGLAQNTPFPDAAKAYLTTAIEDYQVVYELQRPHFDAMSAHARGELMLGLADAYYRLGESGAAHELLSEVHDELDGSSYAEEAARVLAAAPEAPTGGVRTCHGCHEAGAGEER